MTTPASYDATGPASALRVSLAAMRRSTKQPAGLPEPVRDMINLRIVRHDREQVLADCESSVLPNSGEVLQLDTVDSDGEKRRPSTLWRVVSVTLHVPSLQSAPRNDGTKHQVLQVDVEVLPDVALVPEFAHHAEKVLSESRL
ncbi:MAG: hypothetical protein DMD26_13830 [Gemmatimonadetes bacterium]|nr:MAG: hypothetical protein DMD26_13830 [Gemmatimonadota bacterium]